jgi:PAS domain S-box-containing protein
MQVSLRTLLIVPFVLQVVGITSVVGYLSYRSSQQAIEDLAYQLTTETSHRVTEKLDSYLQRAHQSNNARIAALETGTISLDDLDQLHRYLIGQHRQMPDIKTLGFGGPDGTFLTSHRVSPADFEAGATSLQPMDLPYEAGRSNPEDPSQFNLYAIDQAGRLQRPVEIIANLDVRNRPWYRQAAQTLQPGWTEPFQVGRTNLLTLNAYTPFVDEQNQLQGVFFVNISLDQLNQFLDQMAIGQTGEVFILERNGALIANSAGDPAYIASIADEPPEDSQNGTSPPVTRPDLIDFRRLKAVESSNPLIRSVAEQLQSRLGSWEAIQQAEQSTLSISGKRQFLNVVPYRDDYGLDWLIVTAIPEADFMAEIEANQQRTLALSLAALLGSIAFGVWTSRRLVQPLSDLNRATEKLADGDLAPETKPTLIQEVESLRRAFHQMASRLDQSFQALKTSEQRFATLLENVPVGVGVFDPEGRFIWSTPISRQLHGQEVLNVEAPHLSETYQVYKADTDELYPVDQLPALRALRGETATVDDIEIVSLATGQRIPLEVHGAPVFDTAGEIAYAIVAFQDISERREVERLTTRYQKELEREVTRKTAALEEAQRVAQMGSWELEVATRQVAWTQQMFRLVGLEADRTTLALDEPLEITHPGDRPRLLKTLEQTITNGVPYELEHRILRPDGEVRYVVSRGEPVFDSQGQVIKIVGTLTDITSRKRLERQVRENEELFRRAFDDAPIGVALIAPAGQFLRVNRYYCDLLEYPQDELLQMSFQDLIHPEDLAADLAGLQQMNQGTIQTFQMEKRLITRTGTVIPVFLNASCVRDEDGTPLYSIRHIQDIRDRLEVERIKDEFVSIVSHELRTPITSIEGSLQLLGSGIYGNRPEKAQAMLDIAIKNSTRLVRLVDDILSFERLESGKVELLKELCQVEDLMHQAEDSVQSLADTAAVTLIVHPLQATCYAAPDGIVQVLTNLLSNAIKFSNPGGKVVLEAKVWASGSVGAWERGSVGAWEGEQVSEAGYQISGAGYQVPGAGYQVPGAGYQVLGTQDGSPSSPQNPKSKIQNPKPDTQNPIPDTRYLKPNTHSPCPPSPLPSILFSVTDHGRGIPPEKVETIFEQFQQVDASDSRQKGGTGLGLAICKRIVQQHGGEIWVESKLGWGSRFYFTVPVGKERERAREEGRK